MKTWVIFLFICISWLGFTQTETKKVIVIEKKAKYKIDVYATNYSKTEQNVRFHFKGEGFRKGGFKPVTTNIKPKDTIYLTTVYKMKGVNSYLNHQIIYLDELKKKEELSQNNN